MTSLIFALAIGILFGIGVFQLLRRDLIKAAMGFAIISTAVNLFILAVGAYDGSVPAYNEYVEQGVQTSDPLVQALILTAVVVTFGTYSLLLGMISIMSRRFRSVDSDDATELIH